EEQHKSGRERSHRSPELADQQIGIGETVQDAVIVVVMVVLQ
ncbi:19442_t:CDS:2, partial [Racocetra persica]